MESIHITSQDEFRVAVLHQAAATPAIGGVLKPAKQGMPFRRGNGNTSVFLAFLIGLVLNFQGDTRTAVLTWHTLSSKNPVRGRLCPSN
jgi:hypothetical protein